MWPNTHTVHSDFGIHVVNFYFNKTDRRPSFPNSPYWHYVHMYIHTVFDKRVFDYVTKLRKSRKFRHTDSSPWGIGTGNNSHKEHIYKIASWCLYNRFHSSACIMYVQLIPMLLSCLFFRFGSELYVSFMVRQQRSILLTSKKYTCTYSTHDSMLDMGLIVWRTCCGLSSPGPHGICNMIILCIELRAAWSSPILRNTHVYIHVYIIIDIIMEERIIQVIIIITGRFYF